MEQVKFLFAYHPNYLPFWAGKLLGQGRKPALLEGHVLINRACSAIAGGASL